MKVNLQLYGFRERLDDMSVELRNESGVEIRKIFLRDRLPEFGIYRKNNVALQPMANIHGVKLCFASVFVSGFNEAYNSRKHCSATRRIAKHFRMWVRKYVGKDVFWGVRVTWNEKVLMQGPRSP